MADAGSTTLGGDRTNAVPAGLPPSLRTVDLDGSASDTRHLGELLSVALDSMVSLQVECPEHRADLERATALLWVARDLAETIEWKLDRLTEAHVRRAVT